jgi:hypothetical protein
MGSDSRRRKLARFLLRRHIGTREEDIAVLTLN